MILHATLVLVPLLVQEVQGGGAQTSGFVLLGISALGAVAAPFGGRMSDVVGRRRPARASGRSLCAFGLLLLWWLAAGAMAIVLGAILAPRRVRDGDGRIAAKTAALESIEPERVGMAAGTYLTGRYIGGALGATLAGCRPWRDRHGGRRHPGLRAAHDRGRSAWPGVSLLLPGRPGVASVAVPRVAVPPAPVAPPASPAAPTAG